MRKKTSKNMFHKKNVKFEKVKEPDENVDMSISSMSSENGSDHQRMRANLRKYEAFSASGNRFETFSIKTATSVKSLSKEARFTREFTIMKSLPCIRDCDLRKIILPNPLKNCTKTLFLELDKVLIFTHKVDPYARKEITAKLFFVQYFSVNANKKVEWFVAKRPFAAKLLHSLTKRYEIIIYSYWEEGFIKAVLDKVFPECYKSVDYILGGEYCVMKESYLLKDLRVAVNREKSNSVLLDSSLIAMSNQLGNSYLVKAFDGSATDKQLLSVIHFFKQNAQVERIETHLASHCPLSQIYHMYLIMH